MNTPQGMRPFNLQDWQNGAKPICRNGYEPTDFHYFRHANKLVFTNNLGEIYISKLDGSILFDNDEYKYDLFLKSEKKEGWVNLYRNDDLVGAAVYNSEQEAKDGISPLGNFITTLKIEWYE